MTDFTSDDSIFVPLSFADMFPCPCCGEEIPNFPLIERIGFDSDDWENRVAVLAERIRATYPERADAAEAWASMIVSVAVYHAALPKETQDSVKKELEQLPLPLEMEGYVYFIQSIDGGPIKIGYSRNPQARAKGLQGAMELRVLAQMSGGYKLEADMHNKFADLRVNGEWFSPAPELLVFIERIKKLYGRYSDHL